MSTINEQMGYKRAPKRNHTKNLPKNRVAAAAITRAKCPSCEVVGKAKQSATQPGSLYCTWCNHVFPLPDPEVTA